MLIDWDLSKEIKGDDETPRQHSLTVRFPFFRGTSAPPANGICVQGTWQFISISRLRDPSTRPHQVSDDLESFFWVLLYIVIKCRNSTGEDFTEDMKDVFDQHTDMDRNGNVTGGKGKLFCLLDRELNSSVVYDLVKTPCGDIIEDLRTLFHDYYLYIPARETRISNARTVYEAKREGDPRVGEAIKNLSSSEWVLEMINGHLASKWDVDDDSSLHKTMLRPDSAASRDRRKRKAEDSNEEKIPYNQRRKGRLPPRSTEPSRDTVWSQGTHSHSHSRSRTLLGSSSRSATRVSTRSQSLRSYSRGSKATPRGR
jgi:Fungal protein kinase